MQIVDGMLGIAIGCIIITLWHHWQKRKSRRAWELELSEMFEEHDLTMQELMAQHKRWRDSLRKEREGQHMKAKVISIESGSVFTDHQRRITIQLADADSFHSRIQLSESALGIVGLKLDDELDVGFTPVKLYEGLAEEGLKAAYREKRK